MSKKSKNIKTRKVKCDDIIIGSVFVDYDRLHTVYKVRKDGNIVNVFSIRKPDGLKRVTSAKEYDVVEE